MWSPLSHEPMVGISPRSNIKHWVNRVQPLIAMKSEYPWRFLGPIISLKLLEYQEFTNFNIGSYPYFFSSPLRFHIFVILIIVIRIGIQLLMMKKTLNIIYMEGGSLKPWLWIPLGPTLLAGPIGMNSYGPLTLWEVGILIPSHVEPIGIWLNWGIQHWIRVLDVKQLSNKYRQQWVMFSQLDIHLRISLKHA